MFEEASIASISLASCQQSRAQLHYLYAGACQEQFRNSESYISAEDRTRKHFRSLPSLTPSNTCLSTPVNYAANNIPGALSTSKEPKSKGSTSLFGYISKSKNVHLFPVLKKRKEFLQLQLSVTSGEQNGKSSDVG